MPKLTLNTLLEAFELYALFETGGKCPELQAVACTLATDAARGIVNWGWEIDDELASVYVTTGAINLQHTYISKWLNAYLEGEKLRKFYPGDGKDPALEDYDGREASAKTRVKYESRWWKSLQSKNAGITPEATQIYELRARLAWRIFTLEARIQKTRASHDGARIPSFAFIIAELGECLEQTMRAA